MASYLINKAHKDDSVIRFKNIDGYTFRPRVNKNDYIRVKEVRQLVTATSDGAISATEAIKYMRNKGGK